MKKNRQLFSLGENFSFSKHLLAHPRQVKPDKLFLQSLQVQASPSSSDTSFDNTALPIYSCQIQNYFVSCSGLLKSRQSHRKHSVPHRELVCEEGLAYHRTLTVRRKISEERTQPR